LIHFVEGSIGDYAAHFLVAQIADHKIIRCGGTKFRILFQIPKPPAPFLPVLYQTAISAMRDVSRDLSFDCIHKIPHVVKLLKKLD